MADPPTISQRRLIGFVILAVAILVATLAFGTLMSSCQPATLETSPSPPLPTAAASGLPSPLASPTGSGSGASLVPTETSVPPTATPASIMTPAPTVPPPVRTQVPIEPGMTFQIPPPIR